MPGKNGVLSDNDFWPLPDNNFGKVLRLISDEELRVFRDNHKHISIARYAGYSPLQLILRYIKKRLKPEPKEREYFTIKNPEIFKDRISNYYDSPEGKAHRKYRREQIIALNKSRKNIARSEEDRLKISEGKKKYHREKRMKKYTKLYFEETGLDMSEFIPDELLGVKAVDIHHILNKGSGGSKKKDYIENLMALSRECHLIYGDIKKYIPFLQTAHTHYLKTGEPYINKEPNAKEFDALKKYPNLYAIVQSKRKQYNS